MWRSLRPGFVAFCQNLRLTAAAAPTFVGGSRSGSSAWGSGWNYQNVVFFAANNGDGVYEVDTGTIDLVANTVTLRRVGSSDPTNNNDGMNCLTAQVPYSTCGNKIYGSTAGAVTDDDCGEGWVADPKAQNEVCETFEGEVSWHIGLLDLGTPPMRTNIRIDLPILLAGAHCLLR